MKFGLKITSGFIDMQVKETIKTVKLLTKKD